MRLNTCEQRRLLLCALRPNLLFAGTSSRVGLRGQNLALARSTQFGQWDMSDLTLRYNKVNEDEILLLWYR